MAVAHKIDKPRSRGGGVGQPTDTAFRLDGRAFETFLAAAFREGTLKTYAASDVAHIH